MILSIQRILTYILILTGLVIISIPNFLFIGIIVLSFGFIFAYRTHQKNKRRSNNEKHTERRSGQVYDETQNEKKGDKNKKYKKKDNPNKKK